MATIQSGVKQMSVLASRRCVAQVVQILPVACIRMPAVAPTGLLARLLWHAHQASARLRLQCCTKGSFLSQASAKIQQRTTHDPWAPDFPLLRLSFRLPKCRLLVHLLALPGTSNRMRIRAAARTCLMLSLSITVACSTRT